MKYKKITALILSCAFALSGCGGAGRQDKEQTQETQSADAAGDTEAWQKAEESPYAAYPELVSYTLGQMSGVNNSNLPDGDTYEDNVYTRYLRKMLNIQNDNAYMEREDRYDEFINILMGAEEGEDPVGLVCDTNLVGSTSSSYSVEPVFDRYHASPQRWVNQNGEIVYGSVTQQTKNALSYLHELYERGVIDQNFALRAQNNLRDLVVSGKCGAFFGLWWTPNNPLMDVYEKDKNADWEPYYLQQPEHDNVYASFRDNKYVVVRKGYEHPEIVMKIISVLFDYTRYEAEDADDVNEYSALNVEPTARPLVINVDYKEATFQITKDIRAVQNGTDKKESLWGLEKSYYIACENYLHGKSSTPEDWAAYKSRISAVGLLIDGGYQSQEQKYLDDTDGELPKSLQQLEKDSFIQIIMGVKPVSYFDTFVKEWYEQGGEELTEQIRRSNPGE